MDSTVSPRVPTRLLTGLSNDQFALLSPVSGEVLELCTIEPDLVVTEREPTPDIDSPAFLTETKESVVPEPPVIVAVVYIPSEGFIYCLDDKGTIFVYVTAG